MSFPLYTTLIKGISTKELTIKQMKQLKTKITNMSTLDYEYMYVLICSYKMENEVYLSYTLPYGGKCVENDVIFDISTMPAKLKQLLYKFSLQIEENSSRSECKANI